MREDYTQPPLITVIFEGDLKRFGDHHEQRGYSTCEVMQGICANQPELRHYLLNAGVEYQAFSGDIQLETEESVTFPVGSSTLRVVAVPAGSGGTVGRLLGGFALLGIGLATGGTSLAIAGLAAVVSGAGQMFSPKPKTPKTKTERDQSYLFDSLGGAAQDNDPVPVAIGEGLVAGVILSQEVSTADI